VAAHGAGHCAYRPDRPGAASWIRIHQVVRDRNDIVTDRINGSAQILRASCAVGWSWPTRWRAT
jgi:hypothetical protein